ncbi:hypothetical protein H632_c3328p0 [Helicosporidium sp. ATCC 50920]|nr:hypothetical protein H632_c3328p0 [Helicosporidium sp. ATCC 50920]|eukprot:KDD72450.1 hypothetical protein H632_c3328p0 [Helicosporidium sp. ATCC 50920]
MQVGAVAPDFSAPAVVDNEIKDVSLADYKGKYIIFFWYPKDFTFVCPTEIIAFSDRAKEFEALNCQARVACHAHAHASSDFITINLDRCFPPSLS